MSSPFVRQSLEAQDEVDPLVEVDLIVGRLRGVLEGEFDDDLQRKAYELLALWAAAQRVRPDMIQSLDDQHVIQEAEQLITASPDQLVAEALELPSPRAWLHAARSLSRDLAARPDVQQHYEAACDLFFDLDEAELVMYASRRLNSHVTEIAQIEKELNWCRSHFSAHVADFLAAGLTVRALGSALRPDLKDIDPPLARTTAKFEYLLDEMESCETEMTATVQDVHTPKEIAALKAMYDSKVRPNLKAHWLPEQVPAQRAAARIGRGGPPQSHWEGRWLEPDGDHSAQLIVPAQPSHGDDEYLRVTFLDPNNEESDKFDGCMVSLVGVTGICQGKGVAFRLGELRTKGVISDKPYLRVTGRLWIRDHFLQKK